MQGLYRPVLLAMLACCLAVAVNAQDVRSTPRGAAVTLREEFSTRQSRIVLADLLPAGADEQLRQAAAIVDLGRAPEPGSFRVFTAEELLRKGAGKLPLRIPGKIVVHTEGFPVRADAIRRALSEDSAGPLGISADEVTLAEEVVTRSESAAFRVVGVEPGADPFTVTAVMKCQLRTDCGTFVVRLRSSDPIGWTAVRKERLAVRASRAPARIPLVQPGRQASLVFYEGG